MKSLSKLWHGLVCGCHREEHAPIWQGWTRLIFPIMSALALAWFLCRVIPKPIRASYPCQRAAFPLASAFVLWLLGMKCGVLAWLNLGERLRRWRPLFATAGLVCLAALAAMAASQAVQYLATLYASAWTPSDPPNTPMGTPRGIFPGRVVWMRDTNATPWNGSSGRWHDDNTGVNQTAVDRMMSRSVRGLTGGGSDGEAWDRIFHYFNSTHGRGDAGYQAGEKIAIKVNCNNTANYADVDNHADAAPQSVLAILRQLVNHAGIAQTNITVYEAPNTAPSRVLPDRIVSKCRTEFPSVVYADCTGTNGRTLIQWQADAITYSVANSCGRNIPTCVYQATYLINMSLMKGHNTAGVTLTAKNHYGTINTREHTFIRASVSGMGAYSPFVDLIGHPHLGAKTVLFMIDGLYGVRDVGDTVGRTYGAWSNLFGGQWSASYFMSLDPVALDSVGVDFLRSEFGDRLGNGNSANCDNYLHEGANANTSPHNYTQGGQRLPSLGVHEHWNNETAKQYSRNLSPSGTGIELVAVHTVAGLGVTLTNPPNGAMLEHGSPIPLQAAITSTYSTPQHVEYRASGLVLGTATNTPYTFTWTNAPAGIVTLCAIAADTDGLRATSALVNVTIRGSSNIPPAMLRNPQSQSTVLGGGATFVVETAGWPVPSCQWWKDGAPILGAIDSTLALSNVTTADIGTYWSVASNAAGSVTSAWATLSLTLAETNITFVPAGSRWNYFDQTNDLGTAWRAADYDDRLWSNGLARLGYGADGEITQVTSNRLRITTYFRQAFNVADTNRLSSLSLRLQRDDGAVVYLNGTELWRDNMSNGVVTWSTVASNVVSGADETAWFTKTTSAALVFPGRNVFAVEIHQNGTNSSDLGFALEATGVYPALPLAGSGPRLSVISESPSAGLRIQFFAQPGQQYRLLCSTNLDQWVPVRTNVGAGAFLAFTEPDTTNKPAAFYRVVSP